MRRFGRLSFADRRTALGLIAGAMFVGTSALTASAQSVVSGQVSWRENTEKAPITVETVASGLEHPWGLAFLPGEAGGMLVTERAGRLRFVTRDGAVSSPLKGVPPVLARGQAGLLDIALDPDFAGNRLVYLSYVEAREGGSGIAVAQGRLSADHTGLEAVSVIFRQKGAYSGSANFGARLVFAADGTLYVTIGDRFGTRDEAQDLTSHVGKVLRINRDGSIPVNNPFTGEKQAGKGALPEIWSLGHRNPQGAAIHPRTGQLWTQEHGARGGDEVNITRKGLNYGWPIITHGVDYSGAKIGVGPAREGMEQPLYYWVPSIAPSGMAFYQNGAIAAWRNSVFLGALAGRALVRLELANERVTHEEKMLTKMGERIRDVRLGPDRQLYLLTDSPQGRILRVREAR